MTARPTIGRATKAFVDHLQALLALPPEARLTDALDALDALEALAEEARQIRAGAVIDLRLPAVHGGRPGATWARVAELSGRNVTAQAVEQWARQYRGVPA